MRRVLHSFFQHGAHHHALSLLTKIVLTPLLAMRVVAMDFYAIDITKFDFLFAPQVLT
jgi:hypothetical protein